MTVLVYCSLFSPVIDVNLLSLSPGEGMQHLLLSSLHMLNPALPRGGSHAASHIRKSSPFLMLTASNGVNTYADDL